MKKAKLLLAALAFAASALFASAQNVNVSGVVSDSETGEPVMGAVVQLQGSTTKYSMTDMGGNYTLSSVPADGTLVVSILGYEGAEVKLNGRARVDIILAPDVEMLTDAIVLGYGSAKKISSITGSATTVGAKLLQNAPTASVGDALQGQIAGLQVWSNSGEPSETISMRIRGVNSINAGTEPLFVLDGSPVPSSIFTALNANDIENITVMKDASATAIYGSRAANGVVFITTKTGRTGEKPTIVVRGQYGVSNMIRHQIPLLSSEQWFDFNEMLDPTFLDQPGRAAQKDFALDHNINTDWFKYFFSDNAPTWQADASYSGGTETSDYYVSFGALSQEGNAPFSDMTRVSMLAKLNTQITSWFKTGFSFNLAYQDVNTTGFSGTANSPYNPMFMASQMYPWMSPYEYTVNPDGSLTYGNRREYFDEMGMYNTVYLQEIQPATTNYLRLSGNIYEQITPVKGLVLRAVQALNGNDRRISQTAYPTGPFEGSGTANENFSRYYQFTFTNTAEYTIDFLEDHNITALIGQESIVSKTEGFGVAMDGISDNRMYQISDGTVLADGYPTRTLSDESYNSFFGRLSYNYNDTYLFDASFRRDGSSLFGSNRRWANFWSVGGRWNISNESFLEDVAWIDALALKASYGTTGNSSIDNYLSYGRVGNYSLLYDGKTAWGLGDPGNNDLTWEVVKNLNIGVSARLFGSLNLDVDFYNKVTSDMLMEIPFSLTTGHDSGWGNVADMLNRGVDFEISYDIPMPRDFYLNVSANFNYNHNEILSLFDGRDYFEYPNTGIRLEVGHAYGEYYFPKSAGVDPRDGMQMWYDKDGNKTKQFSNDYSVFTGKQQFAPWAGGFNLTFGWKGLSVGAQFAWVAGKWTLNNDRYFLTNPAFSVDGNLAAEMLDMWTTPGQVTDIPSYESERQFDDTLLEDSSFLRLKNLQVSYTLPQDWMRKSGFFQSVRVFAVGRNLLTFTKYTGFDPESDSNLQLGRYPNSKQYTFGVELTF